MNHSITKITPNKQNGYGLIEIVVGVAIAGLLSTVLTAYSLLTINTIGDSKDRMNAIMQVENAGYWISRDIQMSNNITLGENAGFPLQLMRKDTDQNEYEVTYSLIEKSIIRSLIKNEESPVQNLIAQNINTAASLTNLNSTDGLLIFNITSTSGDIDVSRTYKIKPRLDIES